MSDDLDLKDVLVHTTSPERTLDRRQITATRAAPPRQPRKKREAQPDLPYSVTWQCTGCGSRHTKPLLNCLDCGREFASKIDFRRHMQTCDKSGASGRSPGRYPRIHEELRADGTSVWRARGVSAGKWPNGKRRLITITGDSPQAVRDKLTEIGYRLERGTYQPPWNGTVGDLIDAYLASGAGSQTETAVRDRRQALEPAREFFGHRRARLVDKSDIERYRDHLAVKGRRRGGKPGTPLGEHSIALKLQRLQAAFHLAEQEGRVQGNPCRLVAKELPPEIGAVIEEGRRHPERRTPLPSPHAAPGMKGNRR